MSMRLSYILMAQNSPESLRGSLRHLQQITRLPRDQWDVQIVDNGSFDQELTTVMADFPDARRVRGPRGRAATLSQAIASCGGEYVIPLIEDICPASAAALISLVNHIHADRSIGAVSGTVNLADGSMQGPLLTTLVKLGITCFRKSVLDKIGAVPSITGPALDYAISFKILGRGFGSIGARMCCFRVRSNRRLTNRIKIQLTRRSPSIRGMSLIC